MVELMFAYAFAVLMILTQYYMARRNQKQGWTRRRASPASSPALQEASPVRIERPETERPFQHLAELEALNRALIEYHIPQHPESTVETTGAEEAETQQVEVRLKSRSREARDDSSRF
jgi:hypothetical protein